MCGADQLSNDRRCGTWGSAARADREHVLQRCRGPQCSWIRWCRSSASVTRHRPPPKGSLATEGPTNPASSSATPGRGFHCTHTAVTVAGNDAPSGGAVPSRGARAIISHGHRRHPLLTAWMPPRIKTCPAAYVATPRAGSVSSHSWGGAVSRLHAHAMTPIIPGSSGLHTAFRRNRYAGSVVRGPTKNVTAPAAPPRPARDLPSPDRPVRRWPAKPTFNSGREPDLVERTPGRTRPPGTRWRPLRNRSESVIRVRTAVVSDRRGGPPQRLSPSARAQAWASTPQPTW